MNQMHDKNILSQRHGYSSNTEIFIDFYQFIFRFLSLIIIEIFKISYGEKVIRFTLDSFFYLFFLLSTSIFNFKKYFKAYANIFTRLCIDFLFLFILVIDISELISWNFINSAINTQAISAINIKIIIDEYSDFIYYFFLIIPLIIVILLLPFAKKYQNIPKISLVIHQFNFVFFFIFLIFIFRDFRDENNVVLYESNTHEYDYWFKKFLWSKIETSAKVFKKVNQTKNLIQIQLESYLGELLEDPLISPNLCNYSKRYEYISPIYSQPYSGWTIGATILMQTGIPQIMPDTSWPVRAGENIEYILGIKGIPDILKSIGYKIHHASVGESNCMGFSKWIEARNFTKVCKAKNDLDLFNFLINDYLPKIDKDIRESNFQNKYMTLIQNVETHTPYFVPKWCNSNNLGKIDEKKKCFHCVDKIIGDFIRKFFELKMYEHTVLVVFPDHTPYSTDFFSSMKKLFLLFPGIKKVDSELKYKNEITYYDYAPTILDMIGIKEYQPGFPFGENFYNLSNHKNKNFIQKHKKPNQNDLQMIYKFLHFDIGKNISGKNKFNRVFKCFDKKQKTYRISYKPCEITN